MNRNFSGVLLFFSLVLSACISTPTQTFLPTAPATLTPLPRLTPTNTSTPTRTPRPIITLEPYTTSYPITEQLPPLSTNQITEVHDCDVTGLANKRYPEKSGTNDLIYLFNPNTSCDWAVLAFAYSLRAKEEIIMPEIAKAAFGKALSGNPGFALSTPLFYSFFYDSFTITKQPMILDQEITSVTITYKWEGLGDQVGYTATITQANTNPLITLKNVQPETITQKIKTNIDRDLIQALSRSLSNLLPIKSQFSLIPCYDNYPDWIVSISLKDGTLLDLKTNGSNMIPIGGPWQTSLNGQSYVQFSTEFSKAFDTLIRAMDLPYGEPMAMTCDAKDVFNLAYP